MKIGCSSESFARSIASGELTQLEWLDVCANELEVDGVVFASEHFPRTDHEYLAQLKKMCVDLGLTVAGLSFGADFWNASDEALDIAIALGAPLVIAPANIATDDAATWGVFSDAVKVRSRAAKARNVTLAVRNVEATLCVSGDDLRRLAKDIDSSWLRFALDVATASDADATLTLAKAAIAIAPIADLTTFAEPGDDVAATIVRRVARFRGFVILEHTAQSGSREGFHRAVERFEHVRFNALARPASPA